MKAVLVLFLSIILLSCMKQLEEEPLEDYFNKANQNSFEEFQEVLTRIYQEKQVDFLEIPVGLYTFYEVNNQIQTPTNSFLLADFISLIHAREENEKMVHYNIRREEIYYDENNEQSSRIYDEDFSVPKPIGPSQTLKPLEEKEESVTLHNLEYETYKKPVPSRVAEKGECSPCELNIHKLSVDVYNRENNQVEHIEWEISTDFVGYISSDFDLYDGTVSRCNKRWIEVNEGQNVFLSQCWVLRDYGIKEPDSI
ncbi:MAG: hypothetical protein MK008_05605 [Bdellovibrionales bacterium]|nr:hypothetical protein [Bdellovibrionales bacterium]